MIESKFEACISSGVGRSHSTQLTLDYIPSGGITVMFRLFSQRRSAPPLAFGPITAINSRVGTVPGMSQPAKKSLTRASAVVRTPQKPTHAAL